MERDTLDDALIVAGGVCAVLGAVLLLPALRKKLGDALHPRIKDLDIDLSQIDAGKVMAAVGAAAASAGAAETGRQSIRR